MQNLDLGAVGLSVRRSVCMILLGLMCGCGGESVSGPETVDVSGTVKLGGQPLAGATVYFMTDGFTSVGTTDDSGAYQLPHGAVPGTNKVYITKMEGGDLVADPEAGMDAEQFRAMQQATQGDGAAQTSPDSMPKEVIPPEYSDPQKTTLTFQVPEEGTTTADFDL
jgi:hypothetical protein